MIVMIDAGHGIDTPGKRSPDGRFREYQWNRKVAEYLLWDLRALGVDASYVVSETNDVPLKTRSMRVNRICNQVGASNVLLVSVHSNAAGNGSQWMNARGWSCYTSPGKTKSDALAECLYDAFEKAFPDRKIRKDMSDGDRDWEANFYILTKTKCPAVLVENFFYDNKEECAWLLDTPTMMKIADTMAKGILAYIKK